MVTKQTGAFELAKNIKEALIKEGSLVIRDFSSEDQATEKVLGFKVLYSGVTLLVIFDDDDYSFVRIILPNVFPLTLDNRHKALECFEHVAKLSKGAKIFFNDERKDNVTLAVELLVLKDAPPHSLVSIFKRSFSMAFSAALEFKRKMDAIDIRDKN